MGFIKRQLLKVIGWEDTSTETIVYRYPMTDRDEIMNGCQLIVRPSQVAILVAGFSLGNMDLILLLKQKYILLIPSSLSTKNGVQQVKLV